MKKKIWRMMMAFWTFLIAFGFSSKKVNAANEINVKNPIIEADTKMKAGQKVTYDCIYFGSYPQTELVQVDSAEKAALVMMNTYYTTEYEVLSAEEFAKISSATYDTNGDATVHISTGDIKVRRIKKGDATYSATTTSYYNWSDSTSYHYFRYDPIKWRVLSVDDDGNALVRADKGLDDQRYHPSNISVTWETCSIRKWLNTSNNGFYNTAFTAEEKSAISATTVVNKNNLQNGTAGGYNTEDKIILLSQSEVYRTNEAASYGFVKSYDTEDEARRVQPSTYAYAMGAYRNTDTAYAGCSRWWLRSPGFTSRGAAYVADDGFEYGNSGDNVNGDDYAVCPALNLNLSSPAVTYGCVVRTDGSEHDWDSKYTEDKAASCTEAGSKSIHCKICDARKNVTAIKKISHDYDTENPVNLVEATCTEKGSVTVRCKWCPDEKTEEIPIVSDQGHSWDEEYTTDKAATCTETGIKSIHCKFCNSRMDEQVIEKLAHNYDTENPINKVEASCVAAGVLTVKCKDCSDVKTEVITAKGHDWESEYTTDKEATCTTSGIKSIHCNNCDVKKDIEVIEKWGHKYDRDNPKDYKPATCVSEGSLTVSCNACDDEKTEIIPAKGHEWNTKYTIDKEPTCTKAGSKSIHCNNCDATRDETVIPALGHTYGEWFETIAPAPLAEGESKRVCSVCGDAETKVLPKILEDGNGLVFNDNKGITYAGFKITPNVEVYRDGKLLTPKTDYVVSYSNNQNATVNPTKPAKYTITYKGDYKKVKKETFTFTIEQGKMQDATVSCGNLITYSKPGIYKSKPYVDLNGFVLKASDYTVSYWLDEECKMPMDGKFKLTIPDDKEYATIYVKVTGKNKNMTGEKVGSYRVYRKPEKEDSRVNITKCNLQLDAATKKGLIFTGEAFEPNVTVTNGKLGDVSKEYYTVTYSGNIQKGTATIIVTGDGTHAVGSKTINFKIK